MPTLKGRELEESLAEVGGTTVSDDQPIKRNSLFVVDATGYPTDVMNLYRGRYRIWVNDEINIAGEKVDPESQDLMSKVLSIIPIENCRFPIISIGVESDREVWSYASKHEYSTYNTVIRATQQPSVFPHFRYFTENFPAGSNQEKARLLATLISGEFPRLRALHTKATATSHLLNTAGDHFNVIFHKLCCEQNYDITHISVTR